MHPGRAVIPSERTRVGLDGFYKEMRLGVGVIDMPWLILHLIKVLVVVFVLN